VWLLKIEAKSEKKKNKKNSTRILLEFTQCKRRNNHEKNMNIRELKQEGK
jgi:hypothetical protein